MVKTCKYVEQNQTEKKCLDYFISHSKGGRVYCRLTEWKRKRGVCPYDKTIFSVPRKIKKAVIDKTQTKLKTK